MRGSHKYTYGPLSGVSGSDRQPSLLGSVQSIGRQVNQPPIFRVCWEWSRGVPSRVSATWLQSVDAITCYAAVAVHQARTASPASQRPRRLEHNYFMRKAILPLIVAVLLVPVVGCQEERIPQAGEGFIDVPGGRVWYRVEGSGPATPLLLLHGGPGAGSYYLHSLGQLSDERPVVFYDQLGGGRADRSTDESIWGISRSNRGTPPCPRALRPREDPPVGTLLGSDARESSTCSRTLSGWRA